MDFYYEIPEIKAFDCGDFAAGATSIDDGGEPQSFPTGDGD